MAVEPEDINGNQNRPSDARFRSLGLLILALVGLWLSAGPGPLGFAIGLVAVILGVRELRLRQNETNNIRVITGVGIVVGALAMFWGTMSTLSLWFWLANV